MASCTACSTKTPKSSRSRAVFQHLGQAAARAVGVLHRLRRHPPDHHGDAGQRQRAGQGEQAVQADARASSGAATSDSANISPMLPPTSAMALVRTSSRVVGQQRGDGGRDGAGALQRAAGDQPVRRAPRPR
jgi:hypothetical protein